MFWDTLWALVLGFGLSGAVQAFVSRDAMQRRLGDHGPASVARASVYGMASSSCSYAASAMARSLFAQGADFLAAMVFMFASTNLVVELGIVLAVLIGWQFVAAELVGGAIMIVLLVAVGSLWLRGRVVVEARAVATAAGGSGPGSGPGPGDGHGAAGERPVAAAGAGGAGLDPPAGEGTPAPAGWRRRIRTAGGWSDAAGYTMSDLTMLRKEMLVGFVVAGFLTVLVPAHLWNDVFVHGHGFWTSLENAAVGPFVAVISFVCSIGNVPLAAALWRGGISFGGVVAFIFADLITLPLLLVYRKQYGRRMAVRMLGVFWLVMSAAGLATEYAFKGLGWVPTARPGLVAAGSLRWNATTVADLVALVVLAALYWLHRNRDRFGGGAGYTKDPVCGMQVEIAHAPAVVTHAGTRVHFCSDHCADRFAASPARFVAPPERVADEPEHVAADGASDEGGIDRDPVCGMRVDPDHAAATRRLDDRTVPFCSAGCAAAFTEDPDRYLPARPRR